MAKFLFPVWPIETHLTPFLAVAPWLRARGHEVAFYSGPQAAREIEQGGFRWFPFEALDPGVADRNPGAQSNLKLSLRETRQMWHDFLLGSLPAQIRDLEKICDDFQPDAILCDMTLWAPILVLHESRRIPVGVFSHTAYCVLPGRENAAPGISLPPPRTALGRFAMGLVAKVMNRAAGVNRDADRIRARYGLPPLPVSVTEFTGQMPLYLVPSCPELDYNRRDLAATVHYVGPCGPAGDAKANGSGRALVVLEEEHYAEDAWLLRTAAAAFAGAKEEVILMAGHGRDAAHLNLGKLAGNVRLAPWMPLNEALAAAGVVVAHGNSETVLGALQRGIPMVIVPRILEQPQIAWRVAACGAGVRLALKQATPERLRSAAEQVMGEAGFRKNAEIIAEALGRCGGTERAGKLLEGLLRNSAG